MSRIKNIIKNNTAIIDILDSLKPNGLHYVVVPKVKIRNRVCKNQQLIKDIFLLAKEGCAPFKPMALVGIYDTDDEVFYLSHMDITHWNISSGISTLIYGRYVIFHRLFCNQVHQDVILNEPIKARAILTGNLMEGNPNDSYRTPNSYDVNNYTPPRYYSDTHTLIKNTDNPLNIMTGFSDITSDDTCLIYRLETTKQNLEQGLCFAHAFELTDTDDIPCVALEPRWLTKDELSSPNVMISDYFKVYSKDNFNIEEIKIPKAEYDVVCCGCGSAGTQIIDQLVRLNYYQSYMLVDMDCVEEKNLRNQTYNYNHIGNSKVGSLESYIKARSKSKVKTYKTTVQAITWDNKKSHILINGFDNIEARMFMLEQVETGKFETDYIIDARYDSLNADLYMIDTSNPSEMKMYKELLIADAEAFANDKTKYYLDLNDSNAIIEWLQEREVFTCTCGEMRTRLGVGHISCSSSCFSDDCKAKWIKAIRDKNCQIEIERPNTCLEQNIIHIYKYVSTWVTSNLRAVEDNKPKLFTHVMCTVDPLPKAVVVRK